MLPAGRLERKLALGRPLRVKLGHRPDRARHPRSASRSSCSSAAPRSSAQGTSRVLIVGDYTARIGDPSGRSKERPVLPDEVIDRNAALFAEQAYAILDPRADRDPLQRRVARQARLRRARPSHPHADGRAAARARRLRQAVRRAASRSPSPSCSIRSCRATTRSRSRPTSSSGGTDQLYNLLMGRDVMEALRPRAAGRRSRTPLLVGTDGRREDVRKSRGQLHRRSTSRRRSSSAGRCRIPDAALAAVVPARAWTRRAPRADPLEREARARRAASSSCSHGPEAAERAEAHFTRVVREGQVPEEVPEIDAAAGDPVHLPALLVDCASGSSSTSEARRLIAQGGVKVDGEAVPESSTYRGPASRGGRPGRKAALRAVQIRLTSHFGHLTPALALLLLPGRRRDGVRRSLETRQWSALRTQSDTISSDVLRASGASRRLFFAASDGARSLKTQQRAFTSRPRPGSLCEPA